MSRPAAKILLETIGDKNKRTDQILESNGIWSVLFDEQPINIRNIHQIFKTENIKYKKTSFVNPGPAINLAKKLNKTFSTNKFTVVKLVKGQQIYPSHNGKS